VSYLEKRKEVTETCKRLLMLLGCDVDSEGMSETPKRMANMLMQFITLGASEHAFPFAFTTFTNEETETSQMVLVSDISFYSLCEHHFLPFFGKATIAYIPTERIVGLSKLPRVLNFYANRPQNQERITTQVGQTLMRLLQTEDVAVTLRARHLCMEMRGVRSTGAETVTSFLHGQFKSCPMTRDEYFKGIK